MTPSNPAPVGDERYTISKSELLHIMSAAIGAAYVYVDDAVATLRLSTVQQVGAEDARDAARYRVVRSRFGVADMDSYRVTVKPEEIDALIDAAIASSPKSDGGKGS